VSVSIRCAEALSYRCDGSRLTRPYFITDDAWTPVESAGDLEYLLNHRGVLFEEKPELGYRYYQCRADKPQVVHLPGGDRTFWPGETVAANGVLSRILKWHSGFSRVPVVEMLQAVPNLRVLVVRNGGLGDVLMTLPCIARLRHDFPAASVSYSTAPGLTRLLTTNPLVDAVYASLDAYQDGPFGYVLDLGYWAESAPGIERYHRSDIFGHAFGYEDVKGYGFDYRVLDHERAWAQKLVGDKPTVALQVAGSINRRTPPRQWMVEFLSMLHKQGFQTVVFGQRKDPDLDSELNLTGNPPLWQVFAVLEQCVGIVAGDSGIFHAGNALGKPTVGLFGPVDPKLRTRDQPLCRTVTGNEAANCPPCNDHQLHTCEGYPPCMVLIDKDEVMTALMEVIADGDLRRE